MLNEVKKLTDYCRQAITTEFRGPTNHSGSRILVRTEGGHRRTVAYDHALSAVENHAAAAWELFHILGWDIRNDLVMGGVKKGFVFVQVPRAGGNKYGAKGGNNANVNG